MSEPLMDLNHKPTYTFEEGHFYCDGIKVQPCQMTVEEIKLYIPKEFQSGFFKAIGYKPEVSNGGNKVS
jgi:hypothetical protein